MPADADLVIRALGGLTIEHRGQVVSGLRSRTAEALLVFLASTRRVYSREVLAEFLWPERARGQALSNLRTALTRLRAKLAPHLAVTRQTVAMSTERAYWVDATELRAALRAAPTRTDEVVTFSPATRAEVEAALELFGGEFLEGLYIDSSSFEEWALLEREHTRLLVMDAIDAVVDSYAAEGRFGEAIPWAGRLVQLDSLREKTHRDLMLLFARSGRRTEALAQFERCRQILSEELGAEPAPETSTLYERIRGGDVGEAAPALPRPRHGRRRVSDNLPVHGTSFVGRRAEVRDLLERLGDPDCRLLTVVGPGGFGKTRLAVAVARHALGAYSDGVFFVDVSSSQDVASFVNALATAMGFRFAEGESRPWKQLLDYLQDKQMLLVLDSFEHLLESALLIRELLSVTTLIKVVATSREPLGLDWEWQYPIDGLSFPPDAAAPKLGAFDSVKLFVERARRVQPGFSLADNRHCVGRLCQLVEGMPLGIELAAAWLRTMACEDILKEIVRLESPLSGIPARHRSLQALLDHTWAQLSPNERAALMRFSVFRGGFLRDAAEAVAEVTPSTLASLVNKSQLRMDPRSGRFSLHELHRVYAEEKLGETVGEREDAYQRHTTYYAAFLEARQSRLLGEVDTAALDEVGEEIDNVRAAFRWAIDNADLPSMARSLQALSQFYRLRGWHQEAIVAFEKALARVDRLPGTADRAPLELGVLMALTVPLISAESWSSPRLSDVLERAWESCRRSEDSRQLATVMHHLSLFYGILPNLPRAEAIARRELVLGERLTDPACIHAAHFDIGFALMMQGRGLAARTHFETVVDWYDPARHHALSYEYGLSLGSASLMWLALTLWLLGYPDAALERGREAVEMAEALDHPLSISVARQVGGSFVHGFRGEHRAALATAERSLEVAAEHSLGYHRLVAELHCAWHRFELAELGTGVHDFAAATQPPKSIGTRALETLVHTLIASGMVREAQYDDARSLLEQTEGFMDPTGERIAAPEVYRLQGEVLRGLEDTAAAEARFQKAIDCAREQGTRSWELRACLSLCRLWLEQGKSTEAKSLLEPVYGGFTEGLETGDLREAWALLDQLSQGA